MTKLIAPAMVFFAFLAVTAIVKGQTASPAVTPSSTDIAGSAVAAVAVIIVFAFIAYAGYRVIKKWGSSSKGESD